MKKYIFLAASALALASCQSDDFLGNTPGNTPSSANSAIKFDGNAGKISRATSNTGTTAAEMLDYQFKIYGVKKGATTEAGYKPVFQNYLLWYDDAGKNNTTTNKSGWEYVGEIGEHGTTNKVNLTEAQTIKFWDYASDDYRFVAGAPSSAFEFIPGDDNTLASAKIKGLGGHITANNTTATTQNPDPSPVYVAEPVVVSSDKYKQPVTFKFVRQQTKVRVGIYETIPGYSISNIKFYPYEENSNTFSTTTSDNIVLTTTTANYFRGGNNVSGKINYKWSEPTPKYTFEYETTGLKESKNWYGGKFESGVPATASTETIIKNLYGTDGDMHANGYFTVLPTPSATDPQPILIKCDYTLKADDNKGETIEVKGATAAIPAAYSKWNTNTLYTYIFKISENTNGYTGDNPEHVGLYPITFNAVVAETNFGKQGTITTFTTPSITTYQKESVVENGGIKYVAKKEIQVTVTESTSGELKPLSKDGNAVGNVAVYKLTKERTEADLQLASVTTTEVTDAKKQTITLADDSKSFTFTPTEDGWYAIQYLTTAEGTPAVYTYKVVKVEAATK